MSPEKYQQELQLLRRSLQDARRELLNTPPFTDSTNNHKEVKRCVAAIEKHKLDFHELVKDH